MLSRFQFRRLIPFTESVRKMTSIELRNYDETRTQTEPLPSPYRLHWLTWVLALVTGLVLAFTIVYAWAVSTTSGPLTKLVYASVTSSLTILRVTTEVTGIFLALLCVSTLHLVLWAVAASDKGISLSSFLGISPSTGLRGLFALFFWKTKPDQDSRKLDHHRLWVLNRYFQPYIYIDD